MKKQAKMTDGEYDAAVAHVVALWQANVAIQATHDAARLAWYDADARLNPETQAREVDRLVREALSEPQ